MIGVERKMFEDAYLGSAEYPDDFVKQRVEHFDFLKQLGVIK